MVLRKPIVTIMGHVDHGKTKILDTIRHTTVVDREAGAITQAIGASIVPVETIGRICGPLISGLKTRLTLSGLLFIDTPGHAAFTNLRMMGGILAHIAVLVIDINEGIKPQTVEAVEILRKYRTPFVIAANKIDLVSGWRKYDSILTRNIVGQSEETRTLFDSKLYELVAKMHELGFSSERFDRVDDHTRTIALVPVSAKTGEGIAELLMVLAGLAQRFLNECLSCNVDGPGKGTILEVKEEQGLGTTLDVIVYDGRIRVNDTIVVGSPGEPIVTKVRVLLEPAPLEEMRDKKSRFRAIREVTAATGVKISARNIEGALAGMPIIATENVELAKAELKKDVAEVVFEKDSRGIVIKADSLGSLEALVTLLRERSVLIRKASVGNITKKDVSDAFSNMESDPMLATVLGFNVDITADALSQAKACQVRVFTNKVIYRLIEDYEVWMAGEKKRQDQERREGLAKPCKIEVMKGYVFRQKNPAVFGVDVHEGVLKTDMAIMKSDGERLGYVKSLQAEQKSIDRAEKNKQVALSMDGVTVGRNVFEGDILYSDMTEEQFRNAKCSRDCCTAEELGLLKEIAQIKRKKNPLWGL